MRTVVDLKQELTDANILGEPTTDRQTITKTLQLVARAHGVTVAILRGPRRDKFAATARRDAYAALAYLGLTSGEIGRELNRDHSTVLVMLKKRAADKQAGRVLAWKELDS